MHYFQRGWNEGKRGRGKKRARCRRATECGKKKYHQIHLRKYPGKSAPSQCSVCLVDLTYESAENKSSYTFVSVFTSLWVSSWGKALEVRPPNGMKIIFTGSIFSSLCFHVGSGMDSIKRHLYWFYGMKDFFY